MKEKFLNQIGQNLALFLRKFEAKSTRKCQTKNRPKILQIRSKFGQKKLVWHCRAKIWQLFSQGRNQQRNFPLNFVQKSDKHFFSIFFDWKNERIWQEKRKKKILPKSFKYLARFSREKIRPEFHPGFTQETQRKNFLTKSFIFRSEK